MRVRQTRLVPAKTRPLFELLAPQGEGPLLTSPVESSDRDVLLGSDLTRPVSGWNLHGLRSQGFRGT
jgi:hypothetical protein